LPEDGEKAGRALELDDFKGIISIINNEISKAYHAALPVDGEKAG
jgi:hypothetical protein